MINSFIQFFSLLEHQFWKTFLLQEIECPELPFNDENTHHDNDVYDVLNLIISQQNQILDSIIIPWMKKDIIPKFQNYF